MTDRRRQDIETLPNGRLVDRQAMRDYLASLTPTRVRVARLSTTDPFSMSVAAEDRLQRSTR